MYIKFEVQIHGIEPETPENLKKELEEMLREFYNVNFNTDIEVEIIELAGVKK